MPVHTAECLRCGRQLKGKRSLERGYGPVCWEKSQREQEDAEKDDKA